MELDTLKEIWITTNSHKTPTKEVLQMLHKPSQGVVSKMRRNLFIELLVLIFAVTAVAVCYFIAFNGKLKEVSWAYIFLSLFFIGYYYKKNALLKKMQCADFQVKSSLELQLSTLEKYVNMYLLVGTALVPVVMLFFYMLFYYKRVTLFPFLQHNTIAFALIYTLFTIVFTGLLYILNRWYIRQLYGRHIKKLKNLLHEMKGQG